MNFPFSTDLLTWYQKNKRNLPWRHTKDPYSIWLSEIMLQQTTVATVISYYHKFLNRFPTLIDVAESSEDELLRMWAGLGYYNRVRNFKKAMIDIRDNYSGKIPNTKQELLNLSGLGDYTAAAVASIAFEEPVAVVDGNVIRVITRLDDISEDVNLSSTKNKISLRAQKLLNPQNAGDHNQAMMELGATICTPKLTQCGLCPVSKYCLALKNNTVFSRPVNSKKTNYQEEQSISLIHSEEGKYALRKRTSDEIMAGMWEFPFIKIATEKMTSVEIENKIGEVLKLKKGDFTVLKPIRHAIMNRRITNYPVQIKDKNILSQKISFFDEKELKQVAVTTVTQKIIRTHF